MDIQAYVKCHESAFIQSFVHSQSRWKCQKNGINKDGYDDYISKHMLPLRRSTSSFDLVSALLCLGAGPFCVVMDNALDYKERILFVEELTERNLFTGDGKVLSFIPGKLAYREPHGASNNSDRAILHKNTKTDALKKCCLWDQVKYQTAIP